MKEIERALQFFQILDQVQFSQQPKQVLVLKEDQPVLQWTENLLQQTPFATTHAQESHLQARLANIAQEATPSTARSVRRRAQIQTVVLGAGWAAFLVILAITLVLVFEQFTPHPVKSTPQPLISAATPTATFSEPEAEIIPQNLAVVPDACTLHLEDTPIDTTVFNFPLPQSLVGGSSIESGDFRFDLWLSCDSRFSSDISSGADDFSELNGLGLFAGWRYDGKKEDGTLWDYAGFEPFVHQNSGSAPVAGNMSSSVERGIQFATDIIPDFSKQDTQLRYIYFTQLPSGERNGAAMTFTLQREAQGYRPVNITLSALSPEELQGIENQDTAKLPFATRNPIDKFPQIDAVRQRLVGWESSLLSPPGWLYIKTLVKDSGGNMFYGGVNEHVDEGWYKLDAERRSVQSINLTSTLDGRILQQSFYSDGVSYNLTMGNSFENPPAAMSLINGFISKLTSQARTGEDWQPQVATWQGKTVWVFGGKDTFESSVTVDTQADVIAVEGRDYIDPISGASLGNETYIYTSDGQQILQRSSINQTMERVEQPPDDLMALFENPPPLSYSPPSMQGTPPPAKFDITNAQLKLSSYPGDDFNLPTFWVGDIYADDYLLGRLDFGAVPGGKCQRSSDGSTIAYLYEVHANDRLFSSQVQWVSLNDLSTVHKPAEQIAATGSSPSWSPTASQFVFSGCHVDGKPCGLYLVDVASNSLRLLSTAATSIWPIIWKPDGSQLAVIDTSDDQHRLYVLDASSGKTVYEGIFDADAWQVPPDSPVAEWGVNFPHNSAEEGGCFK